VSRVLRLFQFQLKIVDGKEMSEDAVVGLTEEGRSCSPPFKDCDVELVKSVKVDISTQTALADKGTGLWYRVQNVLHRRKVKRGKITDGCLLRGNCIQS